MRDPYIELGIGVFGQAIRDWRLESKVYNYKLKTAEMKKIEKFFKGDFANLIGQQVDIDPKVVLKNLKRENRQKWLQYEKAEAERIKDGQGNCQASGTADEQESAVRQDSVAEESAPIWVCNEAR